MKLAWRQLQSCTARDKSFYSVFFFTVKKASWTKTVCIMYIDYRVMNFCSREQYTSSCKMFIFFLFINNRLNKLSILFYLKMRGRNVTKKCGCDKKHDLLF